MNQITLKSDMFSLGLSILEIIFKIELPKSGALWNKFREEIINFDEIVNETGINSSYEIKELITYLIHPDANKRPTTEEALTGLPQLSKRVYQLKNNAYIKKTDMFLNNNSNFKEKTCNSPSRTLSNKQLFFD